jgi:signal recognition particle subunit SRP19
VKDYKRRVLWLDYFNSALSRGQGRRVPLDGAVRDPTLEELSEAARRLGYNPEVTRAKHPLRMFLASGCVSIEKRKEQSKQRLISEVVRTLSAVRGEKPVAASPQPQHPQQQQKAKRR